MPASVVLADSFIPSLQCQVSASLIRVDRLASRFKVYILPPFVSVHFPRNMLMLFEALFKVYTQLFGLV